ncbi:MAG: polyphosphate kinase 1 [Gallionellaceae bacterium]
MMDTTQDITVDSPQAYINRELSWLDFARRVLELAEDPATPLLERVKFAGIMGMIYDEFAMKRIGGLRRRIESGNDRLSPDGRTTQEELQLCRQEFQRQAAILCNVVEGQLRPVLAEAGIPLLDYDQLDDTQRAHMRHYFHESVEPILTPLATDAGHPFPFISNLSLNLAIVLHSNGSQRTHFARIKVPPNRPRWVPLPTGGYVPLEQVIANNLDEMFPSSSHWECHFFRVTRGAKDDPWDRISMEDEDIELAPGSLIGMVTAELTARRFAGVVRLEVSTDMPESLRHWIAEDVSADPADIVTISSPLALTDLVNCQPDGYPELRDPPHKPITHPRLRHLDPADTGGIFRQIRSADILLHHPYHNYDTSILRFLESAARDPHVLAIKLTIYRTNRQSPIIQALIDAARRGKQVVVLVEITARFDEAPNIAWGEQLEKAGAHVAYGMERLKTHVKLGLVVREEEDGIRRYVHVSTGNYHTGTARLYEDLGILSCNPELGAGASAVFNELTGAIAAPNYGPLLIAPHNLREGFMDLIRREAEHSQAGRPSGIRAKMNQLQDPQIIRELYLASQAGVPMMLNVRGLCCLRAGVPGLSPTIHVYSTLGRFLEHGRIYRFENGGQPAYFIGSADWMRRNLSDRMESIMPVSDPAICAELEHILSVYEQDNCTAWDMQPDNSYLRRRHAEMEECLAAQERFIRLYSDEPLPPRRHTTPATK